VVVYVKQNIFSPNNILLSIASLIEWKTWGGWEVDM